jgi:phenylalanyl-tRNA synthetase alpha chain
MRGPGEFLAAAQIQIANAADLAALDAVRVAFLGKKGAVTASCKPERAPAEQRPAAGQELNRVKNEVMHS